MHRIDTVAATWNAGFVAHHYTRYLGDLSDGHIIRTLMQRQFGFDTDGVEFYLFDQILRPRRSKTRTGRGWMRSAGATADRRRIVDEVLLAYRYSAEVLAELYSVKARPLPRGYSTRTVPAEMPGMAWARDMNRRTFSSTMMSLGRSARVRYSPSSSRDAAEGHVGLPGRERALAEVDDRPVVGLALRLVDGDRPGQPQRELRELGNDIPGEFLGRAGVGVLELLPHGRLHLVHLPVHLDEHRRGDRHHRADGNLRTAPRRAPQYATV